ncbi:hypothetical protein PAEPH01_1967 [Pancytospora epiphaga]|nr:hypothetical protein PAEPH01_1967 [Pancytospora epiphaga]
MWKSYQCAGELDNVKARIGTHDIITNPLIVEGEPRNYAILGVDTILKNKRILLELLIKQSLLGQPSKKQFVAIRSMCQETFIEEYEKLFKDSLSGATKCSVIKHRIITDCDRPIALPGIQVPMH